MNTESFTLQLERQKQVELQDPKCRAGWEAYLPELEQYSPVDAALFHARLEGDIYTSARLILHQLLFRNSGRKGKANAYGQHLMNELGKLPSTWRPRLLRYYSERPRALTLVRSDLGS